MVNVALLQDMTPSALSVLLETVAEQFVQKRSGIVCEVIVVHLDQLSRRKHRSSADPNFPKAA